MPIVHATPPPTGPAVLMEHLPKVFFGPLGHRHSIPEDLDEIHVAEPHPTYEVTLADLRDGRLLEAATPSGWRYLVFHESTPLGIAHLGLSGDAMHDVHFYGFTSGPVIHQKIKAVRAAEALEHVKAEDGEGVELRLLVMPAVHLRLIWLHLESKQVLIPMFDHESGLDAHTAYSPREVLRALGPMIADLSSHSLERYT